MACSIVFGIDSNYIHHTLVCISSLLKNTPFQNFHFYILSLNLSTDNKDYLHNWVIKQKQNITFFDIDYNLLKNFPIQQEDYISLASYLRLFIPQLLPTNISKALYVDGDIVFNGSILDLFNIDISKYAVAAIEDAPNNNPSRLGYDAKYLYFNAGILLLNVDYLREDNFTCKALEYIKTNYDKIIFHDQDVMNALLFGKVLFLPIKWNMLDCYYTEPIRIANKYKKDLKTHQKKAITIHFSGPIKPWHYGCQHPLKKLYKEYAKSIPMHLNVNRWEGINKFPLRIRWMILLKLPWKFIYFANDILYRIEKRLHII